MNKLCVPFLLAASPLLMSITAPCNSCQSATQANAGLIEYRPADYNYPTVPNALRGIIGQDSFTRTDIYLRTYMPIEVGSSPGRLGIFQKNIRLNLGQLDAYLEEAYKTYPATLSDEDKQAIRDYFSSELAKYKIVMPNLNIPGNNRSSEDTGFRYVMTSPEEQTAYSDVNYRLSIYARWQAIYDSIIQAGGQVEIIDGSDRNRGGPREAWTRDKYLLVGQVAYLPDRVHAKIMGGTYEAEIDQVEKFLTDQGIDVRRVEGAWFEGGNIVHHRSSKTIFIGLDEHTDEFSVAALRQAVQQDYGDTYTVIPVPLVNLFNEKISPRQNGAYLYHLDTGLSEELPNGEVLMSPDITDAATRELIYSRVGRENIITLGRADSLAYSANLMVVNNTIITPFMSEALKNNLEARGYIVRDGQHFGLGQLGFGFGGPHCNVNILPSASDSRTELAAEREKSNMIFVPRYSGSEPAMRYTILAAQ